MFCDCHIHTRHGADPAAVLEEMDRVGMERGVFIAPHGEENSEAAEASLDAIAKFSAADPERLIGFAFIEPTLPNALELADRAIGELGLRGFKMMPNHWYPCDEAIFPFYEKVQELGRPILWHSGILWAHGDCSRFCRPAFYEVLLRWPKIRFALAHIGWPWTDECIAVAGRMRAAVRRGAASEGGGMQMLIDTTRGTPDIYREDALRKALGYIGPDWVVYGSDCSVPGSLERAKAGYEADRAIICETLGYGEDDFDKITRTNLDRFLTPIE